MKTMASMLVTIAVIVVLAGVGGITGWLEKELKKEKERKTREMKEWRVRSAAIGYPAGEEHLTDGAAYWVNVSMEEMHPDCTNHLSVIQSVRVVSSSSYLHSPTNRLFALSTNLGRGYYYFHRWGTNTFFEALPPPVSLP